MLPETIDHSTLTQLVAAGDVRRAHVVSRSDGFVIGVEHGKRMRVLKAQRSGEERRFRKMETLMTYLKTVGISNFDVDMTAFAPADIKPRTRPDRAAALRETHAAAEYDRWFRDQVEEGLRLADSPDAVWISNDDVEAAWKKKRAELIARAGLKS